MATVKKPDEVQEILPASGGSYTRNPDGSLTRNVEPVSPAPSGASILPSAYKSTKTQQE